MGCGGSKGGMYHLWWYECFVIVCYWTDWTVSDDVAVG